MERSVEFFFPQNLIEKALYLKIGLRGGENYVRFTLVHVVCRLLRELVGLLSAHPLPSAPKR